jgi:hypothetical protein
MEQKRASYRQAQIIFAFCKKKGFPSVQWAKEANSGRLTWERAFAIVQAFFKDDMDKARELMADFMPAPADDLDRPLEDDGDPPAVLLVGPFGPGQLSIIESTAKRIGVPSRLISWPKNISDQAREHIERDIQS